MRTQALLVADDPVYARWLGECLGEDVALLPADAANARELVSEVGSTPGVSLLFIEFDESHSRERADMVEQVLDAYPDMPVVAVGESEQSEAVLAAMRAGARDYFVLNRDDDNLTALVSRVLRRTSKPAASEGGSAGAGKLLAVMSGPATPGVPFVAMHMALALQEGHDEDKRRVLLVDLTLPGGSALIFLDKDQSYSALDALRDVYRCDQTLVDTAFTHLDNGLFLLSLPEDAIASPAIDADDLGRLLQSFKQYFDYIVVSVDAGISLAPLAALINCADDALLLTDQSVLRSRQNKHLVQALRKADCPLDRLQLLVDHYQPRLGLEPERLASLLELDYLASLSGKPSARIEAMNAGESMFDHAPKDSFSRDVRDLVAKLTGQAPATEQRSSGVLGRFFG